MAGITRGTGNVFADVGFPDAEERQTKVRLTVAINQILWQRRRSPSLPTGATSSITSLDFVSMAAVPFGFWSTISCPEKPRAAQAGPLGG
ncbi:MAG: hypothetical protein ACT4P2_00740 [Pseudomonadota bacterium]